MHAYKQSFLHEFYHREVVPNSANTKFILQEETVSLHYNPADVICAAMVEIFYTNIIIMQNTNKIELVV